MQDLRQFIKQFSPQITDLELDYIVAKFQIKEVDKDKFLIKQGKVCNEFSIIKSCCFKIFYNTDKGDEVNVWFAFEQTPTTEMHSFITRQPSHFNIQAIEKSEVYTASYNDIQQLYKQFNPFQNFGLRLTEMILVKSIERLNAFQTQTAEERYEKLFENPDYLKRIPLKDLASFLGVTPNSLSRLRNNIKK